MFQGLLCDFLLCSALDFIAIQISKDPATLTTEPGSSLTRDSNL